MGVTDNLAIGAVKNALVPLSKTTESIDRYSTGGLVAVPGVAGGTERL